MSTQVFLFAQNQVYGPYQYDHILNGVRSGQITPQHVMSYDRQNWFPASSVWPQLLEQAGIAPAQVPPTVPAANYAPAIATNAPPAASEVPFIKVDEESKGVRDVSDEDTESGAGTLIFGAFMLAAAVVLYFVLSNMEAEGGSMRIHWIIALAYNFGGKWAAVGLCLLVAILSLLLGGSQMMSPRKRKTR